LFTSLKYILLPLIFIVFIIIFFHQSTTSQTDTLKTLIATILGGLLTVFVNLNISTYTSKKTSSLERKKDVYIPINNELKEILDKNIKTSFWESLNTKFDLPIIEKILESSYIFLPKNLERSLLKIKELLEEMKTISHYPIAEEIILKNFEVALKECYGGKGFDKYENPEENIFNYEFPDPYHFMRSHLLEHANIDRMIEADYENIQTYGSMLSNCKEPLLFELPDIYDYRSIDIGEYISEFYPISDKIYENEQIKFKREIYTEIIAEITKSLNQLRSIFKRINMKYEKDND
jgi:hypothetical protein